LGISLSPDQLGSDKTPVDWALVNYLSRQVLLRTKCSDILQNGSFSPSLAGRTRGFFSDIYYENLVDLLEVSFINCTSSPP